MWRAAFKILGAMSFLLVLTVPLCFYTSGSRSALLQAALSISIFLLTAWGGHRWIKTFTTDLPPRSLDARILTGLAFATVFWLSGEVQVFLRKPYGTIPGAFQTPVLIGLLSRSRGSWWFTKPGLWKKLEYLPANVILTLMLVGIVALSWSSFRWWSLLAMVGFLLGTELGEWIGRWVRQWVLALKDVWDIARRMGPPIGGFALGYLIIAFIFAGLFAAVWRADSRAFTGLPEHPAFIDFIYYSVMTISTTGYGDVAPHSPPAKILASTEALIGVAWTIFVFAAVFTVIQRRLEPPARQQR